MSWIVRGEKKKKTVKEFQNWANRKRIKLYAWLEDWQFKMNECGVARIYAATEDQLYWQILSNL